MRCPWIVIQHRRIGRNRRQAIVRDYIRGVARQYATGLYLFGRPGTAKTHTVKAVLDGEIREPYTYQQHYDSFMGPVNPRSAGQEVTATERAALVKPAARFAPP